MLIHILTFWVILILTFVNGLTDATNAISTVVGTKVISYRKACMLSAFFDFLGVMVMSFLSSAVTDCISKIAILPNDFLGMTALCVGMIAAILFSVSACFLGIPTSESHGLIAGITGAAFYISGIKGINLAEWKNVFLGLLWSIVGTVLLTKIVYLCTKNIFKRANVSKIKNMQILSCIRFILCSWGTRWSKIYRNFLYVCQDCNK